MKEYDATDESGSRIGFRARKEIKAVEGFNVMKKAGLVKSVGPAKSLRPFVPQTAVDSDLRSHRSYFGSWRYLQKGFCRCYHYQ
jgi:hypothetical protein